MSPRRRGSALEPGEQMLDADVEPDLDEQQTPRRGRADDEDDGAGEMLLATEMMDDRTIPLFPGVKVVYVGNDPYHCIPLSGHVSVELIGGTRTERRGPDGENIIERPGAVPVEKATRGNPRAPLSSYSFRALNADGTKSTMRMSRRHHEDSVRDRPYQPVRHAEHVYWFARRPRLYKLIIEDESRYRVQEYIARRERARKISQRFVDDIAPVER